MGRGPVISTIREETGLLAEVEFHERTMVVAEGPEGVSLDVPPAPVVGNAAPGTAVPLGRVTVQVGVENQIDQLGGTGRRNSTPEERGEGMQSPTLPGQRNLPHGDGGTPPNWGKGQARQSPLGGGASPVNSQRGRQADLPVGGRKYPTCNMRLITSRVPLVCSLCLSEHHKKCSGLARHELAS